MVSVRRSNPTPHESRPSHPGKRLLKRALSKEHGIGGEDPATRRALLVKALDGRGTVADRISAELGTVRDFYFGPMSQVHASTWSKGRFVMLGDAAYCPTPFTGEGTALGLVGAYVLAGEIKRRRDFAEAFAAYETVVRPYVEASQKRLSPTFIRVLHVKTWFGVSVAHVIQRVFASRIMQRLLIPGHVKRKRDVADDFALPRYS